MEIQIKESRDLLIKGLLYKSNYRGCKETDILIGQFAKAKIHDFDSAKLTLFSQFLIEDDAELYDWILNKTQNPPKYNDLIQEIRVFHDL